jgi:hypothetical protein
MTLRPIKAVPMPAGTVPAPLTGPEPRFEWVGVDRLVVDSTYQRDISVNSHALIRRIVADWDWRRMKPPVVVEAGEFLHVLDGQHTAIAAVTHGGIARLPVFIVQAEGQVDRAKAFYGHNKDRVALNPMQMFWAAVAAGDEDAQTVQQVCERAGVTLLRNPATQGRFKPGETTAVATIKALCKRRTAIRARETLQVLVQAQCAPVASDLIKAVDRLLNDEAFAGDYAGSALTETILRLGGELEKEATSVAAIKKVKHWEALAIVLAQKTRRQRGSRE